MVSWRYNKDMRLNLCVGLREMKDYSLCVAHSLHLKKIKVMGNEPGRVGSGFIYLFFEKQTHTQKGEREDILT